MACGLSYPTNVLLFRSDGSRRLGRRAITGVLVTEPAVAEVPFDWAGIGLKVRKSSWVRVWKFPGIAVAAQAMISCKSNCADGDPGVLLCHECLSF